MYHGAAGNTLTDDKELPDDLPGVTMPAPQRPSPGRTRPVALPRQGPVPRADPPYDDERDPGSEAPAVQGTLALVFEPAEIPAAQVAGVHGSPLIWGPPGAAPDERRLRRLAQAMAEVLTGRRPPETLAPRLTDQAYAELLRAGVMIETPRAPLVGRPHLCQPREDVVEMCVLVCCGERARALALRLRRYGVQWLCTDFETA
ncbi:Rv3235 family protein [Rhizohabitans arisaemae]|uniref:Rv3235 family protein n=1 Tax=Rhizohabitans arisaemae TaxID=2720610 RepID=UPI0024B2210B|nr:Rv3235 family protein [Rhizohabitans arisaemae]